MNERISVKEFLEDKELLELTYIPYDKKVEICETIIEQCSSEFENYHTLNSALLERVKKEIFISSITNLDFSIKDENGLDGYDQLCYHNMLNDLIEDCDYLYDQFEEIFQLMLNDYRSDVLSIRGYFNSLKTAIVNWFSIFKRDSVEYISSLNLKEISDNATKIVDLIKDKK